MAHHYQEDEDFINIDFSEKPPKAEAFERCNFQNCIFTNVDLSGLKFSECRFDSCDFSMAGLERTAFQEVEFRNCKLMGLRFDECHAFLLAFQFEDCQLNFSSFYQLKIPKTRFINCSLVETEFIEADLTSACFDGSDLSGAVFENTGLEKADFRLARHFSIDPELNRIRQAKFSASGLVGLLEKYNITVDG